MGNSKVSRQSSLSPQQVLLLSSILYQHLLPIFHVLLAWLILILTAGHAPLLHSPQLSLFSIPPPTQHNRPHYEHPSLCTVWPEPQHPPEFLVLLTIWLLSCCSGKGTQKLWIGGL